ncbi:hypothetical protein ACFPFV_05990 [Salinicoccus siamensis]|uniref:hypothetical protein n=1 Tax=Salinicoccus siamensis TaxID=381830 RepID=UPI00361028CB
MEGIGAFDFYSDATYKWMSTIHCLRCHDFSGKGIPYKKGHGSLTLSCPFVRPIASI